MNTSCTHTPPHVQDAALVELPAFVVGTETASPAPLSPALAEVQQRAVAALAALGLDVHVASGWAQAAAWLQRVQSSHVIWHDAARPEIPSRVWESIEAAWGQAWERGCMACAERSWVPALPMTETLKDVDAHGLVTGTVPREDYVVLASPQVLSASALRAALAGAGDSGGALTPSSWVRLLQAVGASVEVVPVTDAGARLVDAEHAAGWLQG